MMWCSVGVVVWFGGVVWCCGGVVVWCSGEDMLRVDRSSPAWNGPAGLHHIIAPPQNHITPNHTNTTQPHHTKEWIYNKTKKLFTLYIIIYKTHKLQ